ncbi:MAG TPA: APC family permease [Candidatus Acidoferrales bacterium]|nr:APC family permease [Candidatus Acidoferrales bacterium]
MTPSAKGAPDNSSASSSAAQHFKPKSTLQPQEQSGTLIRGMGLGSAVALNMLDMIGVGPFITLPLVVAAMHGPQALLGWLLGAALAVCDGLVVAELGASMPRAGGPYEYLKQIYGPNKLGRMMSFLFIWQLTFSAPLSIASGCIGLAAYAGFLWPNLRGVVLQRNLHMAIPLLGRLEANVVVTPGTWLAIGTCAFAVVLLYRRITSIGRLSKWLWGGVLVAVAWVISAGATHFHASQAFAFPPGAFTPSIGFFTGLGAAMIVTAYDYWGYYNICYLAGEVEKPERNLPRAVLISVGVVAAIYLVMNVSVLGVIPWQQLQGETSADARLSVISVFMQQIYGGWAGKLVTVLILWTAFGSIFSLLLGYSRVPYAAALDGNYFEVFGRLHPRHKFPYVSLLVMGVVAAAFCFLQLADVIAALVIIRILLQFLLQQVGLLILRVRQPEMPRPFRMWLYPLPVLCAIAGFMYMLISRPNFLREIRYAIVLVVIGLALYFVRSFRRGEWPWRAVDDGTC